MTNASFGAFWVVGAGIPGLKSGTCSKCALDKSATAMELITSPLLSALDHCSTGLRGDSLLSQARQSFLKIEVIDTAFCSCLQR